MAGELDDRWLRSEAAGLKSGNDISGAGGKSGHRPASAGKWATRLVTPGESCSGRLQRRALQWLTESATENKPPQELAAVTGGRETCSSSFKSAFAVRVKRWGKSPPLVWQQTRQGKPRVVQGQIGGESRPGSSSEANESLPRSLVKRNVLPSAGGPLTRATLG
jgi:hypothetical protein